MLGHKRVKELFRENREQLLEIQHLTSFMPTHLAEVIMDALAQNYLCGAGHYLPRGGYVIPYSFVRRHKTVPFEIISAHELLFLCKTHYDDLLPRPPVKRMYATRRR